MKKLICRTAIAVLLASASVTSYAQNYPVKKATVVFKGNQIVKIMYSGSNFVNNFVSLNATRLPPPSDTTKFPGNTLTVTLLLRKNIYMVIPVATIVQLKK